MRTPSSWGGGNLSLKETVVSATPGKPCVQNDMKVMESWETNYSMVKSLKTWRIWNYKKKNGEKN